MAEAAEKNRQPICISQNSLVWQDDSVFKLYYYCMNCACRQKAEICGKQLMPGQLLFSYRKTALELGWSRDKLTRKMTALVQMGYVQIQTARDGSIVTVSNWLENQTAGGMKIRLLCPENQYADGTEISTPCAENKSTCGTKERAENGANAHFSAFAHRRRLENQHTQQQYNNSNTIDTLSHYPDEFEKLWFAYPANRRNDWDEAFRIYQQALRHGATLEIIMTALEAAKSSIAWTKDGGQYIPGISKWLQREPWREANLQKAQKENQEQWNSQ